MPHVVVIGAGPAGLTAAYTLTRSHVPVTVLEADPHEVGGISRTVRHGGFHFDIGGHRFFTKAKDVEALWKELLPDDLLERPRLSRIFYRGRLFAYPLKALDALFKLGPLESTRCVASYVRARIAPHPAPRSFEQWVCNRFGRRLYEIFFKTYTEKVWGMPCSEISADWAAQRIRNFSLGTALARALLPARTNGRPVATLIERFLYPRRGPGMMWEACAEKIRAGGGRVLLGQPVTRIERTGARWRVDTGIRESFDADYVISSMPLRDLVDAVHPALSPAALEAGHALAYRDFITVALMTRGRDLFPDNWIYVHDPALRVGRIQNYKAWSPDMVPDAECCCYGMEYFASIGDDLWAMDDHALAELAARELGQLGLGSSGTILDACVVRQPRAYPVYDAGYADRVRIVRECLDRETPNLFTVGRNGMHRYNNQDHSMLTAMLTARNIAHGAPFVNPWNVNEDAIYIEDAQAASGASGLRQVPQRLTD